MSSFIRIAGIRSALMGGHLRHPTPTTIFALVSISEWITTLSLTVFTQRNFVADVLQVKCDFTQQTTVLRFSAPFGDLWTTYDDHLGLIGKRVIDFLLVLIFAICYGWGATGEYRLRIGVFAPAESVWSTILVQGIVPANHYSFM